MEHDRYIIMEKDITYIATQDFSVTKEKFSLRLNKKYDYLETHPKPTPSELGRYYESEDYISHTDSKNNTLETMYHWVRAYALQKKHNLITSITKPPGAILDIGCGTGDFLKVMQSNRWDVTGYEPNTDAAKIAKSKDINLINDLQYIPDHYYDVITMWHVLEHVSDVHKQAEELKRLLKPNGVLIIAVPNYKSFDAKFYKKYWAAYDVPRHLYHFSKRSIQLVFSEVGLKCIKIIPMYFDSFYVSMLSEKYKTKKINYITACMVGLFSNLKGMFTRQFSSQIYVLKNNKAF